MLIEADALEVAELPALAEAPAGSSVLPNKLVSNLPYAVAATVILDYLQRFSSLASATVMVQKEVADRIAAKPGTKEYGAYTVKLSLRARVAGRFNVAPGNFFPPPHVESSVIKLDRYTLTNAEGKPLSARTIACAETMADAAFANRRKTLANSCKTFFAGRGEEGACMAERLSELFAIADIDARRRGETLTQDEFLRLAHAFEQVS